MSKLPSLAAYVVLASAVIACSAAPSTSDSGSGGVDSGAVVDAGGRDASSPDAGTSSDAGPGPTDASTSDAGTCRPERVSFRPSGSLEPGQLCDDVFICAPDAAYAARLTSSFNCEGVDGFPCDGVLCRFEGNDGAGPGTLNEAEVAEICTDTLLDPEPLAFVCMIYL